MIERSKNRRGEVYGRGVVTTAPIKQDAIIVDYHHTYPGVSIVLVVSNRIYAVKNTFIYKPQSEFRYTCVSCYYRLSQRTTSNKDRRIRDQTPDCSITSALSFRTDIMFTTPIIHSACTKTTVVSLCSHMILIYLESPT